MGETCLRADSTEKRGKEEPIMKRRRSRRRRERKQEMMVTWRIMCEMCGLHNQDGGKTGKLGGVRGN